MTQGNPYGNKGGRWMTKQKFRALVNAGLTYDEIAEVNERAEGWRPSRSSVKYHLDTLGLAPRHASHRDLIPWKVRPEHNTSLLRHMLQAEGRARQGGELSETDRKLVGRLHEMLFGRGKLMVVGYHRDVGFYLIERTDADEDIVRMPRTDVYSGAAELRGAVAEAQHSGSGAGDPPLTSSHTEEQAPRPTVRRGRPKASTVARREEGRRQSGPSRVVG